MKLPVVDRDSLVATLQRLKDLRAWAMKKGIDAWAVRQALVIVMAMDTAAALRRGVSRRQLDFFDRVVRADAEKWLEIEIRRGNA